MKKKGSHVKKLKAIYYPDPFEAMYIPHILKELYIENVYQPYVHNRRDMTVFDLGAHIGLWTMYMQPYAKEIFAVEPAQENYETLLKNADHNDWHVKAFRAAIGNEDGEMKLYHSSNKTAHTKIGGGDDFENVPMWTLSTLFEKTGVDHVDLIKLDIEGAEFEVLGGVHLKKHSSKIGMIIGEMHDWANVNYSQAKWSLIDAGFDVQFMHHDASIFVARRKS